jgi:lipopolysaccharide export system protein LptA
MKGGVKFSQGNTVLSSNYAQISFNLTTNELEELYASGDVVLKSGNDVAMGNEAVYDFTKSELTFWVMYFFQKLEAQSRHRKLL